MQGASEMAASLAVLSAADKEQGTLIPCSADRRMCMVNVSRRDVYRLGDHLHMSCYFGQKWTHHLPLLFRPQW